MLNFFARSGRNIEKIDSLEAGEGSLEKALKQDHQLYFAIQG